MEPIASFPKIDVRTATVDAIVAACSSASCRKLNETPGMVGRSVVKISEREVIKFGLGVTESEANIQREAYRLLDPSIVRVPQVYRFFTKGEYGYLIMEYIKVQVLTPLDDQRLVCRVARILAHMQEFSSRVPGPLRSGVPRGLFWPENEELSFRNLQDIERYFNSRLGKDSARLDFGSCRVVLCHLDVALRNILLQEDGTICLLDWECAGFYPRVLEVCAQRIIVRKDGDFPSRLLEQMPDLTEEEVAQAKLIMQAYFDGQKYYL